MLPSFSGKALPECVRSLMQDENSVIIDYFPKQTRLDLNGNMYSWMGVNLVPFIEGERIRQAVKMVENSFTEEEKERFKEGEVLVFINYKEK